MALDVFQAIRRDGEKALNEIDKLPNANLRDSTEDTLLHTAIVYGNTAVIPALIAKGIDVNAQNNKGHTPLHYAAIHKNYFAAEQILLSGGDVSIPDVYGNTALWYAVFSAKGNYDIVGLFISNDGKRLSSVKNKFGKSPLDFAVQINDSTLIKFLE